MKDDFCDSISTIIKSINPFHYTYSKQNKNINKNYFYFNLNVINFMKILDKIKNYKANFNPKENQLKNNDEYKFDEDIQKTLSLLEKINYNKYLPRSLLNQMKINNNIDEISIEKGKKNENKENIIKKLKFISKLDEKYYKGITLDPGRYDPKYNLIYRRMKDVFIGRPKTSNKKNLKYKNENNDIKKIENINIKSVKNILSKAKYKKLTIKKENNKKSFFPNNMNKFFPQKKIYFNRFSSKNSNRISFNLNSNIQSRSLSPKIKNNSFISFNKILNKNNYIEFRNKKKFSSKINNIENKNEEEEKNREKNRCYSNVQFNNKIISFDKMPGRKKDLFIIKHETINEYSPKFEATRPYMYVKNFTTNKSLQSFKKYAVGKIIRNYHFSPNDYFIFDINSKKKNEINNDFLTIINEKYKL